MTKFMIVSLYQFLGYNSSGLKRKPPREKEVRKPEGEV
jgi:hypothetical protein